MAKPEKRAPSLDEEIHIVGLVKRPPREKIGPPLYSVVTGTASNPIIDTTPEPLEYASEMMKRAIHHLLTNIK